MCDKQNQCSCRQTAPAPTTCAEVRDSRGVLEALSQALRADLDELERHRRVVGIHEARLSEVLGTLNALFPDQTAGSWSERVVKLLGELAERRDEDSPLQEYQETVVEIRDTLSDALPDFSSAESALGGVRSRVEEVKRLRDELQDTRDADQQLVTWLADKYGVFVDRDEEGRLCVEDLQAAIQMIAPIR